MILRLFVLTLRAVGLKYRKFDIALSPNSFYFEYTTPTRHPTLLCPLPRPLGHPLQRVQITKLNNRKDAMPRLSDSLAGAVIVTLRRLAAGVSERRLEPVRVVSRDSLFSRASRQNKHFQLEHSLTLTAGRVKIARHEDTHQYAAVKIVPKPRPSTTSPAAKADKVILPLNQLA